MKLSYLITNEANIEVDASAKTIQLTRSDIGITSIFNYSSNQDALDRVMSILSMHNIYPHSTQGMDASAKIIDFMDMVGN
jgi:alpha-galactosidase